LLDRRMNSEKSKLKSFWLLTTPLTKK